MAERKGIGWAVEQMQNGRRVRRAGWTGMWLGLQIAYTDDKMDLPYVYMRTVPGGYLVPWVCSQTDLLAGDWELAG